MPKPIIWMLRFFTFIMFWIIIDKKITMQNIRDSYNGYSEYYKDDYKTYNIARNAYEDANSRHNRITSKLMFTAQLQGIILMGLALHSVMNNQSTSSCDVYAIIAFIFDVFGILLTLYALSVKTLLAFEYSKFSGVDALNDDEKKEFNNVISKIQDRCDFLADLYKIIITFFIFSLIATFIDLVPIDFLKIDNGRILCVFIFVWFIYKMIIAAVLVDLKEKLKKEEIND